MTVEREQIIEAGARAYHADLSRELQADDRWPLAAWDDINPAMRRAWLRDATTAYDAMAPLIRQQVERETLLAAGQKLRDRADRHAADHPGHLPAQLAYRRHLLIAARVIEPELTEDEIRAGLVNLLGGMADRARPHDTDSTEESL